jgi:large subunit ribosomal protein L7/L12
MKNSYIVKAVAGADGAKGGEAAKETKPKEEKPQEKAVYDMKLVSFDAAKKIALIKEIRAWLNLGLKEVN